MMPRTQNQKATGVAVTLPPWAKKAVQAEAARRSLSTSAVMREYVVEALRKAGKDAGAQ